MATPNFSDMFDVSTLGCKEVEFINELRDLLEKHRGCIEFALTDDPVEQTFFEFIRDLRADPIFKRYNLAHHINLEKPTTNE